MGDQLPETWSNVHAAKFRVEAAARTAGPKAHGPAYELISC